MEDTDNRKRQGERGRRRMCIKAYNSNTGHALVGKDIFA